MECLAQVLAKFGNRGLHLSKLVGVICKLLEDPNHQVYTSVCDADTPTLATPLATPLTYPLLPFAVAR